ncbi:uncharacterized protein LOC142529544 isoform X1 [Primulina tabacum]|uniref:uncharacterized protein LOC142529544 isoform X1 n=1 Tax=Primulina tabacum TaxID=48773 RepID=UPI003F596B72
MTKSLTAAASSPKYPVSHCVKQRRVSSEVPPLISALKTSPPPPNESFGDDVLRVFLREREVSGDFIAKLSDQLWPKKGLTAKSENVLELGGIDDVMEEEVLDDGERQKRLNFLRYEAIFSCLNAAKEGTAAFDSGYWNCMYWILSCSFVSSGCCKLCSRSCFQLLCKHADNISSDIVPQIFTKKRTKRIGIRGEDLKDSFERSVKGASIALSSPRLVIPAAIYGLWEFSQHFSHNVFDFQLLPAMVGLFAYKAATLVQVYRDNEDLRFIFPDNAEDPMD